MREYYADVDEGCACAVWDKLGDELVVVEREGGGAYWEFDMGIWGDRKIEEVAIFDKGSFQK